MINFSETVKTFEENGTIQLNIFYWASDPSLKIVSMATKKQILHINKGIVGYFRLRALKEEVFTYYSGYTIPRFLPYRNEMFKIFRHMKSAGLIDYYLSKYYDETWMIKRYKESGEPKVLTLEHLKVGFYIHVLLITLSFVLFCCEIFWQSFKLFAIFLYLRFTSSILFITRLRQNI